MRMKVIIGGASIAGLYAAYLLAREGAEVEVFEKKKEIGPPPRTLIVTKNLTEVLGFIPHEAIINEVRFFQLNSGARSVKIELYSPDLVIEREKFICLLSALAQEAGAKIWSGFKIKELAINPASSKYKVIGQSFPEGENIEMEADFVIGADGLNGTINRLAEKSKAMEQKVTAKRGENYVVNSGLKSGNQCALFQVKIINPRRIFPFYHPEVCQVYLDLARTKYFFWLIPEAEELATFGLIAESMNQAREALFSFLKEKGWAEEKLAIQAAYVPLPVGPRARLNKSSLYLIGDAAAHVKATTVGGVIPGLKAAQAVANIILGRQQGWQALKQLQQELNYHLFLRRLLNNFSREDYNRLLQSLEKRDKFRQLLGTRTRDELQSFSFQLMMINPELIPLGGKALLISLIHSVIRKN